MKKAKILPLAAGRLDAAGGGAERQIFYLYAPVSMNGWPKNVIDVAFADSLTGSFVDAIGHPLVGLVTDWSR